MVDKKFKDHWCKGKFFLKSTRKKWWSVFLEFITLNFMLQRVSYQYSRSFGHPLIRNHVVTPTYLLNTTRLKIRSYFQISDLEFGLMEILVGIIQYITVYYPNPLFLLFWNSYFYIAKWTFKVMYEVYYRAKRDMKEATWL